MQIDWDLAKYREKDIVKDYRWRKVILWREQLEMMGKFNQNVISCHEPSLLLIKSLKQNYKNY